tara:strand:+ start:475 stop:684 length:210 start_codon:yes stop_codon:yes gene_type:complete
MKPKFKKTRRKGDLYHPWEYQGWKINSSSRMMYNQSIWRAYRDGKPPIVSTNLNDLCVKIDLKEAEYEN